MLPEQDAHLAVAESLAATMLHLRGTEASDFARQFIALAARPVATHMAGDGESFRQALCFPVSGAAQGDFIQSVASAAPYVLLELRSGHLVCLRLADCTSSRLSLSAFLRSIERSLERLPQGASAWPGIQKSIEMIARRRVAMVDLVLEADEARFWQEFFPNGDSKLAESLFRGMSPIPSTRRRQAVAALIEIQSAHYRSAIADFITGLDQDVIKAIRASGLAPSVSQYNSYRRGERATASRRRKRSPCSATCSARRTTDQAACGG